MWFPFEIWENIKDYVGIWDVAKKEVVASIPLLHREFVVLSSATNKLRFKKEFGRTPFFPPESLLNRFTVVYSVLD